MATPNNIITRPTTASRLRHAFQQQNHFAVQGVREHVLPWPPLSGIDCTQATWRLCQVLTRKRKLPSGNLTWESGPSQRTSLEKMVMFHTVVSETTRGFHSKPKVWVLWMNGPLFQLHPPKLKPSFPQN
jgi:hypothetical protein